MLHHSHLGPTEKQTLTNLVNGKQELEQDMAQKITTALNANCELMGLLRALVANAMEDMAWYVSQSSEEAFIAALKKDAVNYPWVLKKYKIPGGSTYTANQRGEELGRQHHEFFNYLTEKQGANAFELGAYECADLIRFYGEVLEAFAKTKPAGTPKLTPKLERVVAETEKVVGRSKEYQLGPAVQWDKSPDKGQRGRIMGGLGTKDGLEVDDWRTVPRPVYPVRKPGELQNDYDKRIGEYDVKVKEYAIIQDYIRRRTATELKIAKMRGGAALWVQTPPDRIAKIDNLFGLAHAATISGTTTDHVFFYNRMSLVDRYLGQDVSTYKMDYSKKYYSDARPGAGGNVVTRNQIIDPIFYIIPLGAIVGAGHHSTIECAAPLTLNGIIDYTIGNYGTLYPPRRAERNAVEASSIKAVMDASEGDLRNKRLLIYYDSAGYPAGYLEFDRDQDNAIWNQIAAVSQGMIDKVAAFGQYPSKAEVMSMHPAFKQVMLGDGVGTGASQKSFQGTKAFWEKKSSGQK